MPLSKFVTRKEFEDNVGWIKEAIGEIKERNKEMSEQLSTLLIAASKQNSHNVEQDKKESKTTTQWGSWKLALLMVGLTIIGGVVTSSVTAYIIACLIH